MKQHNLASYLSLSFVFFAILAFSVSAAQSPVNLGSAGDFVILAKSGVSTTGTAAITGNIGVSPAAATFITGFDVIADASNQYATSSIVTGKLYAADYAPPTPTMLTTAIGDMQTAYTDAAGRTLPDATELGAGNIDGMTLAPGLYKWGTGLNIPNGVTLTGNTNDVWIFQIAQDLTVGNGAIITLSGGAQAKNIFWQVAGQTTIGTTAAFKGNILDQTAIVLNTGATLNGRALAQTAVTIDANTISFPVESEGYAIVNKTMYTGGVATGGRTTTENGAVVTWNCAAWTACGTNGVRTKTCTQTNSDVTSTQNESCTPGRPDATGQTPVVHVTVTTPTPSQSNNAGGAEERNESGNDAKNTTDDVPTNWNGNNGQSNDQGSWWNNFRSWWSGLFRGNK